MPKLPMDTNTGILKPACWTSIGSSQLNSYSGSVITYVDAFKLIPVQIGIIM